MRTVLKSGMIHPSYTERRGLRGPGHAGKVTFVQIFSLTEPLPREAGQGVSKVEAVVVPDSEFEKGKRISVER